VSSTALPVKSAMVSTVFKVAVAGSKERRKKGIGTK